MAGLTRREIVSVADARKDLSKTLRRFRLDANAAPIVLGSHRKPEAVLVSYEQFIAGLVPVDRPVSLAELGSKLSLIKKLADPLGITGLSVFGSVARAEETLGSNVDLLIDTNGPVSHFDIVDFAAEVEDVLGARVDVLTRAVLETDRLRRASIEKDLIKLY
jgi:predicted nucleotidyltransferase